MEISIKRKIILDNYNTPKNRVFNKIDSYLIIDMNNESCVDEIIIMAKIENSKIIDIKFMGEACAICISSTSIMTELLIGKTKEEAKIIINNFKSMIKGENYNEKILKDANVYNDMANQPNRHKCLTLGWNGIEKLLDERNS